MRVLYNYCTWVHPYARHMTYMYVSYLFENGSFDCSSTIIGPVIGMFMRASNASATLLFGEEANLPEAEEDKTASLLISEPTAPA